MDSFNSYWVVLSDKSGTVLDWKALALNTPASLMFPQKEDSVNVTIIEKLNTPSLSTSTYEITTYTNVVPGGYGITTANTTPVQQNVSGDYTLKVPNPTDFFSVYVGSDCGWSPNSDWSQYDIGVCAISSLYVWALDPSYSEPHYLYIPQINAGGSTVFDLPFYKGLPVMKNNLISFNEPTYTTSIVTGTTTTDQSFLASFYEPGYLDSKGSIYYPDKVGSLFKSLNVEIIYNHLSNGYVEYYYGKQTQDVSTITVTDLPANLVTVSSQTLSHLSYQLSGSAHYANANFDVPSSKTSSSSASTGNWSVYSRFGGTVDVKLPQLSSSLIKDIDFSFLSDLEFTGISITEDNDHGSYTEFYKNAILVPGSSNLVNFRQKSYGVKPDGSIGGREKNVSSRLAKYKKILAR